MFRRFADTAIIQDRLLAHVHMAFNRKFDSETLTDLFNDLRIFSPQKKGKGIGLNSKFMYEDSARSCMIRSSAVILQGMMVTWNSLFTGRPLSTKCELSNFINVKNIFSLH